MCLTGGAMDRERIRAILQLDAVFQGVAPRLNDVFDTLALHGMSLEKLSSCTVQDLTGRFFFSPEQAGHFIEVGNRVEPLIDRIPATRLSVITRADSCWPANVRRNPVAEMVPWLFVIGDPGLLGSKTIGIGGSRDATARTLEITRELASHAVMRGATIVNGGARGVDSVAHQAALEHDGKTVVVLAQGIATFQVPPHWWEPIGLGKLAVVSEFGPFAAWEAHQALQRNGTAVRLSDAFVVVQAERKSGTSSAGRSALRMKRPLFVVSQTGEGAERFAGSEQ
jgi:predicted Rossmann fold nucleotide-binding protein DprA/Smf involved in DNA uptake